MTTSKPMQTSSTSTVKMLVLFGIILYSSCSVFGQNSEVISNVVISSENVATPTSINVSENSNMNLYSWFMGTKQTPNANLKNDASGNIKKQMINSGIEPNRLLLKSFLKKATNYTEVIA